MKQFMELMSISINTYYFQYPISSNLKENGKFSGTNQRNTSLMNTRARCTQVKVGHL